MKIIIAPDSYKDCLSAVEVAKAMEEGLRMTGESLEIVKMPVADGGEGTVEAIIAGAGGKIIKTKATDPLRNEIDSFFGILSDKKTAVIEMAAASGLELVPLHHRNPLNTTTFGTGELILAALDAGCSNIIIGVGGSSTNDCGMGMAQALGVVFFDENRIPLSYGGRYMNEVRFYNDSNLDKRIKKTSIRIACDVSNPLFGKKGAAYVYGPQKGASARQIKYLDEGLQNMSKVIKEISGKDISEIPGAGAAGGLAGGLMAFTDAKLEKGIDIVIETCAFMKHLNNTDLILTGEGKTDFQTAFGKVPVGVSRVAKEFGIPVICISGALGNGYENVYKDGILAAYSISPGAIDLETSIKDASKNLINTTYSIAKTFFANKSLKR